MKNVMIRFVAILLAFQGFVAAQLLTVEPAHASAAPDVIINEVMWMGSFQGITNRADDEWIELRNTTEAPIDISGWTLSNTGLGAIPNGSVIPAEGFFLIANYSAESASSVLDIEPDWVSSSIVLSNTCTAIELALPDMTVADTMGCGSGYFAGTNNTAGQFRAAMERNIEIGDGTLAGSWHTAVGFANLDAIAVGHTAATPQIANDVTPADETAATVNDGQAADVEWSDSLATASANWDGFTDPESGLSGEYNVELLDSTDAVIDSALVSDTSHTFGSLTLSEGEMYHFAVTAINGVGLESLEAVSNGFTIDTANPDPASNPTVSDVASDNGGSVLVQWDASPSMDEIAYRVDYNKVGGGSVQSQDAGSLLEVTVNGLENGPVVYEFTVVAIDFSGRESLVNPTVQGSALDNIAPMLDPTKLVVAQNKPGTNDMVSGGAGFSTEAATVTVFDRHPTDPVAVVIASVQTGTGFGFDAVSIGDNRYGMVWLQLVDAGGNASTVTSIANDIVGPGAPTITSGKVTCKSISCRVELNWAAPADSTEYVVEYGSGVNITRTAPIANTTLILDLPANGSHQSFVVYALDQFGNSSAKSNSFSASLVAGVVTSGSLNGGALEISTAALEGSKETLQSTAPTTPAKLVPTAQAADDEADTAVAGQQDWLRIVIVVILLLIVAGGFYSLSRSMQAGPLDAPAPPAKKAAAAKGTKSKRQKRGSRR